MCVNVVRYSRVCETNVELYRLYLECVRDVLRRTERCSACQSAGGDSGTGVGGRDVGAMDGVAPEGARSGGALVRRGSLGRGDNPYVVRQFNTSAGGAWRGGGSANTGGCPVTVNGGSSAGDNIIVAPGDDQQVHRDESSSRGGVAGSVIRGPRGGVSLGRGPNYVRNQERREKRKANARVSPDGGLKYHAVGNGRADFSLMTREQRAQLAAIQFRRAVLEGTKAIQRLESGGVDDGGDRVAVKEREKGGKRPGMAVPAGSQTREVRSRAECDPQVQLLEKRLSEALAELNITRKKSRQLEADHRMLTAKVLLMESR